MFHLCPSRNGGLNRRCMAMLVLLATSIGLLGCRSSPQPVGPRIEPVSTPWVSLAPARYGFANPGGSGDSMPDGSFVLSPDRTMRLDCQRRPSGYGQSFLLSNPPGGASPVELFSSDTFEPGVPLTSYWYRVVWDGRSRGLYVTAFCPESPPDLAIVQYWTPAGEVSPVDTEALRGWAIVAAVAGTDFLVVMGNPPEVSKLAILDPKAGIVGVLPGGVAWEDSTPEGYILYAGGNLNTPNPIYLGATGTWEGTEVAAGWCARFRPGSSRFTFAAPNEKGTTTVWEGVPGGGARQALVDLPFAQVSDFFWSDSATFYVLGMLPQAGEGSILKVALPEEPR